jgi:hypothetical protein
VAIASAAEPGEAGRQHQVAIASAAEPGEAGRQHQVAIASAAEPGEAGRHHQDGRRGPPGAVATRSYCQL